MGANQTISCRACLLLVRRQQHKVGIMRVLLDQVHCFVRKVLHTRVYASRFFHTLFTA